MSPARLPCLLPVQWLCSWHEGRRTPQLHIQEHLDVSRLSSARCRSGASALLCMSSTGRQMLWKKVD